MFVLPGIIHIGKDRRRENPPEMPTVRMPRHEAAIGGQLVVAPGVQELIGDREEKTGKGKKKGGLHLIG